MQPRSENNHTIRTIPTNNVTGGKAIYPAMKMDLTTIIFIPTRIMFISILCSFLFIFCHGSATYQTATKLFNDKLGPSSGYNTIVRPINDQTKTMTVNVSFEIISIVEVDSVKQQFVVNGFLGLTWIDERLAWNITKYSGLYILHPEPEQIWRPRVILGNTLGARDLFEDDHCPILAFFTGELQWYPGKLFPTSCKLNLYKFPFDTQHCTIEMSSNGWLPQEVVYHAAHPEVRTNYYVKSGEWHMESTKVETLVYPNGLAAFRINFYLKRLPGFCIVNIVTPVVLMSFLNILVFILPVDSGEKISYGITVLLAVSVFMSIVSGQLPRSSDTLPLVTIYLLVLTMLSVCTVIVSIIAVYCHHREEKEAKYQQATSNFIGLFNKVNILNRAVGNFTQAKPGPSNPMTSSLGPLMGVDKATGDQTDAVLQVINSLSGRNAGLTHDEPQPGTPEPEARVNRWRQLAKHLDCVSFVVFMVVWVSVTIGFLVEIAT